MSQIAVKRIAAPKSAKASLIFFHGLGDTCDGWAVLAQEFHKRPDLQHINIVLPTAPTRLISGFGQESTGWFDLHHMGPKVGVGCAGVFSTLDTIVEELVAQEIKQGIEPSKIMIGGFSQGGAVALSSAISLRTKLAGFISHSGFLTQSPENVVDRKSDANLESPVLMLHGLADDVVPFIPAGKDAYEIMVKLGFKDVKLETFSGLPHSACRESIDEILNFAGKVL